VPENLPPVSKSIYSRLEEGTESVGGVLVRKLLFTAWWRHPRADPDRSNEKDDLLEPKLSALALQLW